MRKLSIPGIIIFGAALGWLGSALGWAADYLADGPDAARTGWVKGEKVFNTTNVKTMKLLWKTKLDSAPREMHNLFPPAVVEKVSTPNGTKEIAVVAGISDNLFGIDTETGKQIWTKHFDSTYAPPAPGTGGRGGQGGTLCPGGQTATPVIGPGSSPGKFTVYAVGWDGRLRQVNVADGEDLAPPQLFMPPNTKPWSLNLDNGVIYTAISQGCGGVPFAFFSYDLGTKKTSTFLPQGGGLWGRRGVAVASDGTIYMGTGDGPYMPEIKNLGNSIVAMKLDQNKQLQLAGWFAPPNANWLYKRDLDINVSPMAIDYKGKHFLIGTSKECRVWLLDRDNFGGADHRQFIDRSPLLCNDAARYDAAGVWGAMSTWQDPSGALWVAVPFLGPASTDYHPPMENGKITRGGTAAMKIEEKNGKWQFTQEWLSADIDQGDEAIYENGILFVNAAGEDTYQQRPDRAWDDGPAPPPVAGITGQSGTRIANSRHAVIYALDAATGKQLWSSGDQIASWNHGSGMTAVNGKAYIGTYDGYFYCFGVTK